jgi:hypothetical protein
MSITSITEEIVQFTKNDIGTATGEGKYLTEQSLAAVLSEAIPGYVKSGLTIPTGASLTQQITAGVAFVSGYRVTTTATNLTFPAASVLYVFLSLVKDAEDLVTEAVFEITTSTTPTYPDYLAVARITTDGSAVTKSEDISFRSGASAGGGDLNPYSAVGL